MLKERHGYSGTTTYIAWLNMKQRCLNPRNPAYKYYGAKGIKVCEHWKNSFLAFLADMGECPIDMTLERIDNSKGYEPTNCKWATWIEQDSNKSRSWRGLSGQKKL